LDDCAIAVHGVGQWSVAPDCLSVCAPAVSGFAGAFAHGAKMETTAPASLPPSLCGEGSGIPPLVELPLEPLLLPHATAVMTAPNVIHLRMPPPHA
jgi:hypothetical protein